MKKLNKLALTLIEKLISKKMIDCNDKYYFINRILNEFNTKFILDTSSYKNKSFPWIFNEIGNIAEEKLKVNKEIFINKISDLVSLTPKNVRDRFENISKNNSQKAFEDFYRLSNFFYYVKKDRNAKNIMWKVNSKYGPMKLTINKSKPEKSIYEIAKVLNNKNITYPKCVLCKENIGLSISNNKISKQNLRFVNVNLNNKKFFMHYSPYEYYKQHLIVNNWEHIPMHIDYDLYKELLDFVNKYPFYFISSNADLPIVGGSILNHKHFQGGLKDLPIFEAKTFYKKIIGDSKLEILQWPLATIKISNSNRNELCKIIKKIHNAWFKYKNQKLMIFNSQKQRHNSITPIVEYQNNKYIIYLILRNNSVSKKNPTGNFHIKKSKWNIKKENIGLIEASGKAILPARLEKEIKLMKNAIEKNQKKLDVNLKHHQKWYENIYKKIDKNKDIKKILFQKIGETFISGLEDANVFKDKNDLVNFLENI